MKSLALLTLASAAAVVADSSISIDSFAAACVEHSTQCNYYFNVNSVPGLPGSNCTLQVTSDHRDGADYIPNVSQGTCADNDAWTWTTTRYQDGALGFAIWWYDSNWQANLTSCHLISQQDLTIQNDGATQSEHYVGATEFSATSDECYPPA